MGHFGECNRNNEGRDLLNVCLTNEWVTGHEWFEEAQSHEITRYCWD